MGGAGRSTGPTLEQLKIVVAVVYGYVHVGLWPRRSGFESRRTPHAGAPTLESRGWL